MEVLKEVILLGVGACLPIIIVACIVYGIWISATAEHEYFSDVVYCTNKHKDKSDTYIPMNIGGITNFISIGNEKYISIFRYNNKKVKSDNKDVYKKVNTNKKYIAKIDIITYRDGTIEYDVAEIISEVKEK